MNTPNHPELGGMVVPIGLLDRPDELSDFIDSSGFGDYSGEAEVNR